MQKICELHPNDGEWIKRGDEWKLICKVCDSYLPDKIIYSLEVFYDKNKNEFRSNINSNIDIDAERLAVLRNIKLEFDRLFIEGVETI